eukprot:1142857-Rhodomonas_salina.3
MDRRRKERRCSLCCGRSCAGRKSESGSRAPARGPRPRTRSPTTSKCSSNRSDCMAMVSPWSVGSTRVLHETDLAFATMLRGDGGVVRWLGLALQRRRAWRWNCTENERVHAAACLVDQGGVSGFRRLRPRCCGCARSSTPRVIQTSRCRLARCVLGSALARSEQRKAETESSWVGWVLTLVVSFLFHLVLTSVVNAASAGLGAAAALPWRAETEPHRAPSGISPHFLLTLTCDPSTQCSSRLRSLHRIVLAHPRR